MCLAGRGHSLLYRMGLGILMKTAFSYRHGGSPRLELARLGLQERPVLDFSVNLNCLGSPAIVSEKWQELFGSVESYPSVDGDGIAQYYCKKFGIPSNRFLAGNGSTEMIYLAPRALRLKSVVIITPSYHDYERASILASAKVIRCTLSPESNFSPPGVEELIDVLGNASALWLGRPNNPTGTMISKDILLELADRFPDKWFIIDEAFIQFVDRWEDESFLTERRRPNILVIHSLTKFYALAGLRLGGIVGDEGVISRLREAKEPWTVNGIADKVAPLLLECVDYERKTRSDITKERARIFQNLKALDWIIPFPSSANFILCQWTKTGNLDDLMRYLLLNGVYVRDCRNFSGLEKSFFRIGLRTPTENDQLISLVSSF